MTIEFEWNGRVVGIPYGEWSDHRGDRHEFIDLRKQPGRIVELPEPNKWPELRDALVSINSLESSFQTLGCEAWGPVEGAYPAGLTHSVGAYVQTAFVDHELAESEQGYHSLAALFFRFCKTRDKAEPIMVRVEFEQFSFARSNAAGYCVTWWIGGFGTDFKSAREMMSTGLVAVCDYLRSWPSQKTDAKIL